jgi:hypothetical protein
MNINDPFGRLQSKRQKEYESLRDSLKELGVTTLDDAQSVLDKIQRRGIWGLTFIVPATLLLALVLTGLRAFVLLCGALAAFWLFKTVFNSREYVKRYIEEELSDHNDK